MSIDEKKLEMLKYELETAGKMGFTNVRVRNDVHQIATKAAQKKKQNLTKFVMIAIIEKIMREEKDE
ncbi:hypothetical protein FR271_21970 [Vibrio vulnificus]|nr:hypothetical protein [Vibrio vulnificus]EGR0093619.1 hypothetical protein [Vibrio vulnificus]EIJ0948492.1 hypothetical protein [Vibrio vulnificus]